MYGPEPLLNKSAHEGTATTMRKASDAFTDTIFEALDEGRLTEGQLVSPEQVETPGNGSGEPAGWLLNARVRGDVFDAMLKNHGRHGVLTRVLGFGTGRSFLVYALQVGTTQLRVVLPLVGNTVAALLRSPIIHVRLYVDTPAEGGVAGPIVVSPADRAQLTESHSADFEGLVVARDMLVLTANLLAPEAMGPAEGMSAPANVCLSAIPPPEFSAWTKQTNGGMSHRELMLSITRRRASQPGEAER